MLDRKYEFRIVLPTKNSDVLTTDMIIVANRAKSSQIDDRS
jgi:hypothetical protein